MLKVLHVMGRMEPTGTELQLAGMLRVGHGVLWDATLCVLRQGSPLSRQVAASGVPVVELPHVWDADPRRLLAVRKLAAHGGFDVVHSSLWGANVFTRMALLGAGSRPAVVVSERSVETFRSRAGRLIDQLLRHVTDLYIGNSQDVVNFIVQAHRVHPDLTRRVSNGLDREIFHPEDAGRGGVTKPRIGTLGRLSWVKGFDGLIEAFSLLLKESDAELLIAGDGPERSRLEHQALGLPVSFLGAVNGAEEVASFLRTLDVFVLPSHLEGLPNAVLEAMACGVPTVVTDAPGMREATAGQALLVPPKSPAALAAALAEAIERPIYPTHVPAPSFEDVANAHLAIFEEAVALRSIRGELQPLTRLGREERMDAR